MNYTKKNLLLILFTLFTIGTSFSQTFIQAYANVVNQCSQTNINDDLTQFESLGLKRRGTASLQNTLDWLKSKYSSYGYTTAQVQEDSYTYSGSTAICKNLIVTKVGTLYPNTYVIVCGHYDSIGGTGTNDNGSGTSCILETARLLQNIPTDYSIKFINFSGEEDGLYGSQHYVSSIVNGTTPKMNIRLVINLDEVGGVAGLTNNTITCERDTNNSPSTNNAVSSTMTTQLINCVTLYSPLQTFLSYAYASDYMSFQSNNEIITGLFEKNETTHKHTNTDLLIYMDPVYNYNVAKATIGATMHFAVASTTALNNEQVSSDFNVSFFPNPTKDVLNINLGSLNETNYTFSLIDINGKVVLQKSFENAKLIESISVNTLAKGLYLAIMESGNNRITKKIVIE
ncbi:M28 family peptidase [Flavobacterium sp. SUN052]|uniref:M28 family peptidase n=1 Tax=Flavobacterium sp. SUN052 TaxID=3002441 RepID=UPI00237D7BE1|nr:M28 family peptidase [Flavobacterium sp. SUN052]MEC4004986.1 M28 family peptidase [Flavobacterium sp. SUN052]